MNMNNEELLQKVKDDRDYHKDHIRDIKLVYIYNKVNN